MELRALLVSTYDLGHQPFGLASAAAWLTREGLTVRCADLAKQRLDEELVVGAALIAFHLPMHTATRMAAPVIARCRALNPSARLCAYGLYAPLNADWLQSLGVTDVLGGEFEDDLGRLGRAVITGSGAQPTRVRNGDPIPRLAFLTPDRSDLPALTRYATMQLPGGARRVAGYTEATRGCRHLCRHCPVVPVYDGQFRVVQPAVVLEDIARQVAAGAEHITFGDPDFLNGPTHAVRIVEQMHERFPALTYDVTIKIEHLLKHRHLLAVLRHTGCVFVTSAVESLDDRVLLLLDKGHTRLDFERAADLCRTAGVPLIPTFVAFHPWMSVGDYCDLLEGIVALDMVDHVAPIQLAIRLLVPSGSRLLDLAEMRRVITGFDSKTLTHRWVHPDPGVDGLQAEVAALVGRQLTARRRELFQAIVTLAWERTNRGTPPVLASEPTSPVAYFDEPWYCCAEPNPDQLTLV